jgi:hypothetical protein
MNPEGICYVKDGRFFHINLAQRVNSETIFLYKSDFAVAQYSEL